jgi:archaemetzincin
VILPAQGAARIQPQDAVVRSVEAAPRQDPEAPGPGVLPISSSLRHAAPPTVALQPLGAVDPSILQAVAASIRALLSTEVAILPARSLPDSAYYTPRHRYRGDDLLAFLDQATPAGYSRVIGITGKDISVTRGEVPDWGVFGVARLAGRPGLVSTFRLGAGSAPLPVLEARLEKVVVHELGHTFGLRHCSSPGCVMRDAEGSIRPVDSSTGKLCPSCASRLDELLGRNS